MYFEEHILLKIVAVNFSSGITEKNLTEKRLFILGRLV